MEDNPEIDSHTYGPLNFDRSAKELSGEKRVSSTNGAKPCAKN